MPEMQSVLREGLAQLKHLNRARQQSPLLQQFIRDSLDAGAPIQSNARLVIRRVKM